MHRLIFEMVIRERARNLHQVDAVEVMSDLFRADACLGIHQNFEGSGAPPFVALFATQLIEAGEELRYDYFADDRLSRKTGISRSPPFKCRCGGRDCQWLDV